MFRKQILLSAVFLLVAVSGQTQAVDLNLLRMQRPVEPNYQTDAQEYCLLVFGSNAQSQTWIVRDGETFFIDQNGNGNLTDPGEAIVQTKSSLEVPTLRFPGASDRYTNLRIYPQTDGTYRLRATIRGKGSQTVGTGKAVRPEFGSTVETAAVIHFDGPKTLGQYGELQTIPRDTDNHSYRVTSLKLMVGTPGIGKGTFAAYHCKCRREKTLSGTAEFPSTEKRPLIAGLDYRMKG